MRTKIYKEYKDIKDTDKLLKQQVFLSTYIDNEYDNIDRMLLFHGIGSGKTCSSITIAETIMKKRPQMEVLVILPARLKTNFIDELISETCGFNKYISVNEYAKYIDEKTTKKEKEQIRKIFLKRIEIKYNIISYESLRNQLLKTTNLEETIRKITNNKIIIIDEVHNLISSGIDKDKLLEIIDNNKIKSKTKQINSVILRLLTYYTKDQKSTKMFLLTATPVFDNYGQFIQLMLNLRPDLLNENIHKFEPIGFSILYLLSESHLSVHTFPEKNHISFDIYTCRQYKDNKVYENIFKKLIKDLDASEISFCQIIDRFF